MLALNYPSYFQSLLTKLNIKGLPASNDDILTTSNRKNALSILTGLVHFNTIQVIYKILMTQTSKASQERNSKYWDGEYYYIPQGYLNKKYGSRAREVISEELICLEQLGIISISQYIKGEKCKGFKVLFPQLLEAFNQPITLISEKVFLALSNNKKSSKPSDIARQAAKNIPVGFMNLKDVCDYFSDKIPSARGAELDYLLVELTNVFYNWVNQVRYDSNTNILVYRQIYHTTETGGRPYANSGEQFASRELKTAWFNFDNVNNYDVKACHLAIFNQNNPTNFVDSWINSSSFKEQLANKINIPISIFKDSVLALLYGGSIAANDKCTIFQLFINHFGNYETAKKHLELFKGEMTEFKSAITIWMKQIRANPKAYQRNQLGLKTDSTDPQTLASHYLTGIEQKAINWVSSVFNQKRGKFMAISNQYDGLVTIGQIPDELLATFSDKFGLSLVIKPFN